MKSKKLLFIILGVLFIGLMGWWFLKQNAPIAAKISIKVSGVKAVGSTSASSLALPPFANSANGQPKGQIEASSQAQSEVKIDPTLPDSTKLQMIFDAQNSGLHDLYGKVIDQFGRPVVGAQAIATSVFVASSEASRNEDRIVLTDAQGIFQFTSVGGWRFGVGVKMPGYVWSGHGELSENVQSTPERRDVFIMYKLQGAEPMTHQNFIIMLPGDGTQINVNLQTGKAVTTGGDMTITFARNPVQIVRGTPFEWALTMDVPSGGLLEMHDLYPYVAPEIGYKQAVIITTGPTPKNYVNTANQTYYFKSADGKFGRVTIGLHADFQPPPTLLGIEVYFNPSGSRNLEWDPAKEIKPK